MTTTFVTNSTAERTFSKLKLIKTALRNRMGDKFLSNQAIIGVNYKYNVNVDNALENLISSNEKARILL